MLLDVVNGVQGLRLTVYMSISSHNLCILPFFSQSLGFTHLPLISDSTPSDIERKTIMTTKNTNRRGDVENKVGRIRRKRKMARNNKQVGNIRN